MTQPDYADLELHVDPEPELTYTRQRKALTA